MLSQASVHLGHAERDLAGTFARGISKINCQLSLVSYLHGWLVKAREGHPCRVGLELSGCQAVFHTIAQLVGTPAELRTAMGI